MQCAHTNTMNAYFPPSAFCIEQQELLADTVAVAESYLLPDSPGLQIVRYHSGHLAVTHGLATAHDVQRSHIMNRQLPPDDETAEMLAIAFNEQLVDTTDYTGRWLAGQLGEIMLRSILVDEVDSDETLKLLLPVDAASIHYDQAPTSYDSGFIELGRLSYGKGKLYDNVDAYRIVAYDQEHTRNLHCIAVDGIIVDADTRVLDRNDQAEIFCENYFPDQLDDAIALLVGNFQDPTDLDSRLRLMLSGLPAGTVTLSEISYFRERCLEAWDTVRQENQKGGAQPDAALIANLRDWLS
jgi:hypothetical protein